MSEVAKFDGSMGETLAARLFEWAEIVDKVRAGETFYLAGVGKWGQPVFTTSHHLCCGYQHGCELGQPVGGFKFPYVTDQPKEEA